MAKIHYAVEIITGSTYSDPNFGISYGTFRFITDRPGYDGQVPYPTNEDSLYNTYVWYEGFLYRNGLSRPNRRVDITLTGDYGTLSGFNFSLKNTTALWDCIKSNNIPLINREVKFYVVIDNVFYQSWNGVITNSPYDETDYKFICKDNFNLTHKELPPTIISSTNFPNATKDAIGKAIPICFGKVPYVESVSVGGTPEYITLNTINNIDYDVCAATIYSTHYSRNPYLWLLTQGQTFARNQLVGKYISVVAGSSPDPNKEDVIRISNNSPTSDNKTRIEIERPLSNVTADDFPAYSSSGSIGKGTWFFQVSTLPMEKRVSERSIVEFIKNQTGTPYASYYNEDEDEYAQLGGMITNTDINNAALSIISSHLTRDSVIKYYYPIVPISVNVVNTTGWLTNIFLPFSTAMTDRDRTVYAYKTITGVGHLHSMEFDVVLPTDILSDQLGDLYFGIDWGMTGPTECKMRVAYEYNIKDIYGNNYVSTETGVRKYYPDSTYEWINGVQIYNFLPNDYYAVDGNTNGEASLFGTTKAIGGSIVDIKDHLLKIDSSIVELIKTGSAVNTFRIKVSLDLLAYNKSVDVKIKQVGFIGVKEVNTSNSRIFARVNGEKNLNDQETTNIYRIFKHILNTYDEIDIDDIDFGNLLMQRGLGWTASRQITARKNSINYLKELCKQTFVCLFPTRTGKRGLSAWRDNITSVAAHNESNIKRNSIKKIGKSAIEKLYNQFDIKYAYNPGSNDFDANLFIKNIDQPNFPAETEEWESYVGGVHTSYYQEAKLLWQKCHAAYLRINNIATLPDALSRLPWYNDPTIFAGNVINHKTFGDKTTLVSILKVDYVSTNWVRFVYNSPYGSNPAFATNGLQSGDYVTINSPNFDSNNNGRFQVVGTVYDTHFYLYNENGVDMIFPQLFGSDVALTSENIIVRTELQNTGLVPTDPVFRFVKNLVEWVTLQKEDIEYSLPITADHIVRELLNRVTFNDIVYTKSVAKGGWITKVEINPKTDSINLRVTLEDDEVIYRKIKKSYDSHAAQGWDDIETSYQTKAENPSNAEDWKNSNE